MSASTCMLASWSVVDMRAYPSFIKAPGCRGPGILEDI
jgi:hypothetical protein